MTEWKVLKCNICDIFLCYYKGWNEEDIMPYCPNCKIQRDREDVKCQVE